MLYICSVFAQCLLDVCSMFARSRKRDINERVCRSLGSRRTSTSSADRSLAESVIRSPLALYLSLITTSHVSESHAKLFGQNFVELSSPTLITYGTKNGKRDTVMWSALIFHLTLFLSCWTQVVTDVLKLVKIWRKSDKNGFAHFLETRCSLSSHYRLLVVRITECGPWKRTWCSNYYYGKSVCNTVIQVGCFFPVR